MPLPEITVPHFDLVLPSSKKKIKFRPFIVKEEKLLIIALESRDPKQVTTAIKQVLSNCILTRGVKIDQLPSFDIEYLFLNIRGKSVGEELEVNLICPDDGETRVDVTIPLCDIKVQKDPNHTNIIQLDEQFSMKMRYPSLSEFIQDNFVDSGVEQIDQSFKMVAKCVEQVFTEEESWAASDHTEEEMVEFIEGLGTAQFKQLEEFFTTMPKLSHTVQVTNPKTGVKSDVVIEGLASFFS